MDECKPLALPPAAAVRPLLTVASWCSTCSVTRAMRSPWNGSSSGAHFSFTHAFFSRAMSLSGFLHQPSTRGRGSGT